MMKVNNNPAIPLKRVVAIGDFGRFAAQHLSKLVSSAEILSEDDLIADSLPRNPSAIRMLLSGRQVPHISEAIEASCYRDGAIFISLTLQDCTLVLGPVVVPGIGCCWRCWSNRELQKSSPSNIAQRRSDYYLSHHGEEPYGYLPSLARLGATLIASILGDVAHLATHVDEVIKIDVVNRQISRSRIMGFDNCDRCGLHRPLASRSYFDLRTSLCTLPNLNWSS